MALRLAKTLSLQTGRKIANQSREDTVKAVSSAFSSLGVVAIQIGYEVIRVSFSTEDGYKKAMERDGIRLFGIYCKILGGGPPITMVHVFDYPFEETDEAIKLVFSDFGNVKAVKKQTYLFDKNIFTGTRLVSLVLRDTPPRSLAINGYTCRIWYRGQPLVCNLCGVQGHKSSVCPNRDKCRKCGQSGHFARACPRPSEDPREGEGRASVIVAGTSGLDVPPQSSSHASAPHGASQDVSADPSLGSDQSSSPSSPSPAPAPVDHAVSNVSSSPPAEGSVSDLVEEAAPEEVSPVGDSENIVEEAAPEKVSPAGDSENIDAEDAYAFTCGQEIPDSQVSFLSTPAPSPEVSEPGCSVVVLEEGVAASQSSDGNPGSDSRNVPDDSVSVPMEQSPVSEKDPPAALSVGRNILNTVRNKISGKSSSKAPGSKVSGRKAPYSRGFRHGLPQVVDSRPKPGQLPKR